MYNCPKCQTKMIWNSDNEDADERTFSLHVCPSCDGEFVEYWGVE